jgi:hypothetical protein
MGNADSAQTLRGSPTVSTARNYGREVRSVGERMGIQSLNRARQALPSPRAPRAAQI